MSSQSKNRSCSGGNTSVIGSKSGREYEKLLLLLLAKKGYELSIDNNSQFRQFAIGREVDIGEDRKLDDIVFRYEDNGPRNLIFIQIKHKEENKQDDSLKINSRILSGSGNGKMNSDFSLQEYFISYLRIRKELQITKSKEFRNGKIKYIAIFTNIGLDMEDLKSKGFDLNEAPEDVRTLFQLKKSPRGTQETNNCYQLLNISEVLERRLKRSSDLHKIATEFARYVVWESHREKKVMKMDKAPIKYYHVALEKEVIEKSNTVQEHSMKDEHYCVAKFRNDFIDNNETGPKKQLLNAIFEAIREIDKSKRNDSDEVLKNYLRNTEWKVVSHFGDYLPKKNSSEMRKIAKEFAKYIANENERDKIIFGKKETALTHYDVAFEKEVITISDQANSSYCKAQFRDDFINNRETGPIQDLKNAIFDKIREFQSKKDASDDELENLLRGLELKVDPYFVKTRNLKEDLQNEWIPIEDVDIADFLKCLVFLVNQPNETDLITQISSVKEVFLQGTRVGEALDNMDLKLKDRIEKVLRIYKNDSNEEVWMYDEEINDFIKEQQAAVNVFVLTCIYEEKVMQYGKFKKLGKLKSNLRNFLNDKFSKVLCLCSSTTILTLLKVLMYLNTKNSPVKRKCISVELDDAKCKIISDIIEKAFMSESYNLLTIDCQNAVSEDILELYCKFSHIIKSNTNKKIILIINGNKLDNLTEKIGSDLKDIYKNHKDHEKLCIKKTDDIIVTDFESDDDPLEKRVIVFQEQNEKVNLATLTGILNWNNYISASSPDRIQNEKLIIDATMLGEILKNNQIVIGSKPLRTDSLQGAYAPLFERINEDTLANKLLHKGNDCDTNDMYIVSGIRGLNRNQIIVKLIEYLGLTNKKVEIEEQVGDICSDSRIKITDDKFKDKDFKDICHKHTEKKIFWICVKDEKKAILQQFYNPNFYLKRKFKRVIFKKNLLMHDNSTEIFIISRVNDQEKFLESLGLIDETEKGKIKTNCENEKIQFLFSEDAAEATFIGLCKEKQSAHWLKFEENHLAWCNTHGAVNNLRKYFCYKEVEEDDLIKEIIQKKVVIIADDPGMGKTTTLTKLYESFIATHWVILIKLRDHLQAIRNVEQTNGNIDVIDFLTEVDVTLNHNLAKSLLQIALDKSKNFLKPLLLAFDGFDEVLDEEDRSKIISLLKFLKEETSAKVWITTRHYYKDTLEDELSSLAIGFVAMDEKVKKAYIEKYLKDRLYLILSEEKFAKFFLNNDEMQENRVCSYIRRSIHDYTKEFLNEMRLVFKDNIHRFIGTPLQLRLMLADSTSHLKNWIENEDQNLNFSNLGQDLWEVYEKFIDKKYGVYFEKVCILQRQQQEFQKLNFDECHKALASSSILGVEPKRTLIEFKDVLLSVGIIKYLGNNTEFIHATFKEYFVAKLFFDWVKVPIELLSTNKQRNMLIDLFKKPHYELTRAFINLKLNKITKSELQEISNNYRVIAEKLIVCEQESLDDEEEDETVLHIAVEEGSTNIACFLLNTLKGHEDMKIFLFMRNESEETALHLACDKDNYEIVCALLDAAEEISEDALQDYLHFLDESGYNALDRALMEEADIQIVKTLLEKANNKLDLIVNNEKSHSSLCLACECFNEEFVEVLLQEFKDDMSLKKVLLFKDSEGTAVNYAVISSSTIVEYFLCIAKSIGDNNETLKMLLLPEDDSLCPLNVAVAGRRIDSINVILNSAKNIDDNNFTLRQLFLNVIKEESSLNFAAVNRYCDVIKVLLETASVVDDEMVQKLIFFLIKNGKTAIRVIDANGYEKISVDSLKIFEEDKYCSIRKKIIDFYYSIPLSDRLRFDKGALINAIRDNNISQVKGILDSAKNSNFNSQEKLRILLFLIDEDEKLRWNTLHRACLFGCTDIVKELLSCAININDEGETLKKLLTSRSYENKTPFEMIKCGYISEIKQIIEILILETNNEQASTILQGIQKYEEFVKESCKHCLLHCPSIIYPRRTDSPPSSLPSSREDLTIDVIRNY